MSFKLPEAFLINYDTIDVEHLQIVSRVNTLLDIAESGYAQDFSTAFDELLADVKAHFQHEEVLMADVGYDGLKWHTAHHAESLAALDDLYATCQKKGKVETSDIYFCFDHVITDIAKADLKFGEFLDGMGGRKIKKVV